MMRVSAPARGDGSGRPVGWRSLYGDPRRERGRPRGDGGRGVFTAGVWWCYSRPRGDSAARLHAADAGGSLARLEGAAQAQGIAADPAPAAAQRPGGVRHRGPRRVPADGRLRAAVHALRPVPPGPRHRPARPQPGAPVRDRPAGARPAQPGHSGRPSQLPVRDPGGAAGHA